MAEDIKRSSVLIYTIGIYGLNCFRKNSKNLLQVGISLWKLPFFLITDTVP